MPVGRLLEDFILQGGVDTSLVRWVPYDGIGRDVRNGLNFTERGFGVRGAVGTPDRGHTAASQMKVGDVDWEHVFGKLGVRWFHTGGIFAALSATTAEVVIEAAQAAHRAWHGGFLRPELPPEPVEEHRRTGQGAGAVNREIAQYVDVMIGNEEDFTASARLRGRGRGRTPQRTCPSRVLQTHDRNRARGVPQFPGDCHDVARRADARPINDWSAVLVARRTNSTSPASTRTLEIMDRVGGGDSFASGLIYGFLAGKSAAAAVNYGAAHGALAMTTPGDTSMASREEVEKLMKGGGARVVR